MMKKTLIFSCLFSCCGLCLLCQTSETIKVAGKEATDFLIKAAYKYPGFTKASVYFKNGDIAGGRLNYDYLDESMKFINEKGDTLTIANEDDINYISAGSDIFFYDKKYYERVASSVTAKLAVRHTLKLTHTEKTGAFGISSPNNNVESRDKISDVSNHRLDVNEVLVFLKQTTYYISSAKGHFGEANKKNISKLFPGRNLEAYIDQNKLNLNKEDLVALFAYVNKSK